jgi:hypothetical protein
VIIEDSVFLSGGKITMIGSFVHIACHSSITGGSEFVTEAALPVSMAGNQVEHIAAACREFSGETGIP